MGTWYWIIMAWLVILSWLCVYGAYMSAKHKDIFLAVVFVVDANMTGAFAGLLLGVRFAQDILHMFQR